MTELSSGTKMRIQALSIFSFYVVWQASSLLIFLALLILGGDTSDTTFIAGVAIIPGIFGYSRTKKHYTKKYESEVA